jgi:hypothetical protein
VFLDHIDLICFLHLVTHLHAIIWITYTLYTCRIGFMVVDLLSSAVMSVIKVFPSYMMLSLACVFVRVFGLPSAEM